MLLILQMGQPALLYLVPCTLIPAVFLGWRRKELKNLWTGTCKEEIRDEQGISENSEASVSLLQEDVEANKQV